MTTKTSPIIYDEAAIAATTITAADTNVTGSAWFKILRDATRGVATGMDITLSAVADTATISVGRGLWAGFVLEVSATHTVNLPAVLAAKTYSVGVLYNPANYSTAAGCLTLAVFDKAAITLPTNGLFFTLYEVDRTPSQTLSVSTLRNYRHSVSASLYIPAGTLLPPAAEHSFGTIAITPTAIHQRRGVAGQEKWDEVTDDTGDQTSGITAATGWANTGTVWSHVCGAGFVNVIARRTGAAFVANTTNGSLADQVIVTLPSAARPTRMWVGGGSLSIGGGGGATMGCDIRIYADGRVVLTSTAPGLNIPTATDLYVSATYRN